MVLTWVGRLGRAALLLSPFLFLGLVIVVGVNWIGAKLERHDRWFRVLSLRLDNLHEERERRRLRAIQLKLERRSPPPLSEARTIEIEESLLLTLRREAGSEEDES